MKDTSVVNTPLHNCWLATALAVGVGFTTIVNVLTTPLQILDIGVIVISAVTGTVPVLMAVNVEMLPVPEAPSPIVISEFVHE